MQKTVATRKHQKTTQYVLRVVGILLICASIYYLVNGIYSYKRTKDKCRSEHNKTKLILLTEPDALDAEPMTRSIVADHRLFCFPGKEGSF